uniref:Uncharacterized protein n=1 Tax=Populus trichocarpa TaxID=3694 RepID=A0A3N7G6N3_POPTR
MFLFIGLNNMYSPRGSNAYGAQSAYAQYEADVGGYRDYASATSHYEGQHRAVYGSASMSGAQQGILTESLGKDLNDHVFTLVEGIVDAGKNSGNTGSCEELLGGDEEGERSVASVEDQRKEMTIYEKFIMGIGSHSQYSQDVLRS